MEDYKESKGGRPRKYSIQKNKSRIEGRKKIRAHQPVSRKNMSEEELQAHINAVAKRGREKEYAEDERLKIYKEDITRLLTKREKIEFRKYINEKNKKRLDEIFADKEAMERIFADRDDIGFYEIQMERKKKNSGGKWITADEIRKAEREIWGGEVFGEEIKSVYKNPYGELPE